MCYNLIKSSEVRNVKEVTEKKNKNPLLQILFTNNLNYTTFLFQIITMLRPFEVGLLFLNTIEDIISFFNLCSLKHKDVRNVFRLEFVRKLLTFQMGPASAFQRQGSGLLAGSSESPLGAPGSPLSSGSPREERTL